MLRSLKRQLRYRIGANRTVWLDGVDIAIDPGIMKDPLIQGIKAGDYEHDEASACRAVLSPGDRVLEIGAGIGFISTICAKICGSENVLCYEANRKLEKLVRKTHALNGVSPELRMRAVATSNTRASYYVNSDIVSSGFFEESGGRKTEVQADALDEILSQWAPNVLIVDAEGAEASLLTQSDLSALDHLIVEFHPHLIGEDAIASIIAALAETGLVLSDGDPRGVCVFARNAGSCAA